MRGAACAAMACALAWGVEAQAGETACMMLARSDALGPTATEVRTYFNAATQARPAYCELRATLSPVEGSRIGIYFRLPEAWNGKVLGLGGGGFSGDVDVGASMPGLARGYVTMQTDAGHQPPTTPGDVMDASWASDGEVFDWPALEDFGHRAIHEMTVAGKQVARRYYGRAPKRAYYQGCSTGGRQGLMEAQRYPDDYDGIIAGAPVFDTTVQTSGFLRGRWFGAPEAQLPQALLEVVTSAAVAACDPLDGVADSVITDPRACDWRPDALACGSGAAAESCLTPPQVEAVANAYAGLRLADGRVVAQPAMRGGESGWLFAQGVGDPVVVQPNGAALFLDGFDVDASALSAEALLDRVSASRFAAHYNANDPDLAAFARRGGKLLLFHGWLDSIANPTSTTDLYDAIREETGAKISSEVSEYVRLFMVPGLRHCVGGPGANTADWLTALETWVETGAAPDLMLARHQAAGGYEERDPGEPLERPLCPYPTAPRYVGGDPNAAESFRCE